MVLDELIIVVNGKINFHEREKLSRYSNRIFQRENLGYDGGAYKDAFTLFLKEEDWNKWDELLLINDTFYGPFYQWKEIFSVMDGRNCDFWGLSCHPGGRENLFGGEIISPHVQSYFILIKKRMFLDDSFWLFWNGIGYSSNYKQAIKQFEIYFSEFFLEHGFSYDSWIAAVTEHMKEQTVPGMGNMELLIKKWHFPILKRKACMLQDYISLKRLFEFLSDSLGYPTEVMREDLRQRCLEGKMEPYNPYQVLCFCEQFEEIYLFGRGGYAKNIEQFLEDYGKQVSGYLVSKAEEAQEDVYELEKFLIKPNRGVIVALNYRNFKEVYHKLEKVIPAKQRLLPFYGY